MLRSLKFTALALGMMGAAGAMAAGPDLTVVSFGGANKAAQVKAADLMKQEMAKMVGELGLPPGMIPGM